MSPKVDFEPNFFTWIALLGLLIGIVNIILPMQDINTKIFPVGEEKNEEKTYDENEPEFDAVF